MTPPLNEDSNLIIHAKRELELLGEEQEVVDGYLQMIQIFVNMGHSGGSASCFIPTLNALLQFRNLKPLTDDPDEWMDVSDDLWQSTRRADAFSNNGGKTYYLLDEPKNYLNQKRIHISDPSITKGK